MDKCRRCGHCCIICTDINLAKYEVSEGLYAMRRQHPSDKKPRAADRGWSRMILLRELVYLEELDQEIFACVYLDPGTRECIIYEDRPVVCRAFDCGNARTPRVHSHWLAIKRGRKRFCLDG